MASLSATLRVFACVPPAAAARTRRLHRRPAAAAVGRGFLAVSGDEVGDALVWGDEVSVLECALLTLNPSDAPIALSLSLPTTPRVAFVLEAPGGDVSTRAPTLNGGEPLVAGAAGDLPPLQGAYCGGSACAADIVLPPRSQAFFVLLDARARACGSVP